MGTSRKEKVKSKILVEFAGIAFPITIIGVEVGKSSISGLFSVWQSSSTPVQAIFKKFSKI